MKVSQDLSEQIQLNQKKENTIDTLLEELKQKDVVIERITIELRESNANAKLAEQQYDGLKSTIDRLQEDNDKLTKSNDEFVNRIMQEKEKYMEEMNKMTVLYEHANKKIGMLQNLQEQEKKRFTWKSKKSSVESSDDSNTSQSNARKFGSMGVVIPSGVKQSISAHRSQATCVRYDTAGGNVVATSSEDSTVKIWSTGNGNLLKTLRGGSGQVMLGLDICGDLTAGCGSDKTCRIWNTRTQRLVHQLVGHSQRVTAVRLLKGNAQAVLTASADRSMKVWDISRHTYRQSVTLKNSSSANCLDVSYDGVTAVAGHLDGGVRFFDIRSSERTGEVSELHSGGVTSVNFNPNNNAEILTTGRDSTVKLVDVRKTGQALQTFFHSEFRIDVSYAACAISPDGRYAAAGSSTGDVFIWKSADGVLEKQLKGHEAGVIAVAWDRGGSNGQQFSSVDKKGNLLLWA
jgi:autophagy-related protein 16